MLNETELNELSIAELVELQAGVEKVLANKRKEAAAQVKQEILNKLKEHGMTLEDLAAKSATAEKLPAKYRHPENAALEWSGRGRKPNWVTEWLGAGRKLEELAIA